MNDKAQQPASEQQDGCIHACNFGDVAMTEDGRLSFDCMHCHKVIETPYYFKQSSPSLPSPDEQPAPRDAAPCPVSVQELRDKLIEWLDYETSYTYEVGDKEAMDRIIQHWLEAREAQK